MSIPLVLAALKKCGGVEVGTGGLECPDGIYGLLQFFANWIIGVLIGVAVLGIVWQSVRLTTSSGSPDTVKDAKSKITNIVVALALLSLSFFILRLILPTGTVIQ